MTRLVRCLGLVVVLAFPASAEEAPVLAEYWTNNGSLPPAYAWETGITIRADGALTLRRCTGYETEGPACKTRRAKIAPEALEVIREAAAASGLRERPARLPEAVMVGGDMTGGLVWLDGARIDLPSDVHEDDVNRVAEVIRAIETAIPDRFARFLDD